MFDSNKYFGPKRRKNDDSIEQYGDNGDDNIELSSSEWTDE